MAHPLDGSRARIERAGDHLEELDTTLARFVKEGSFIFRTEQDAETGEYVLRVYSQRQPPVPPPPKASAIVGDVLYNLRAALDYVVWQLAASPSKKNQFPIFDSPEDFEAKAPRYLDSVPPELWAKFEALQPYHGEGREALALVAKLNDVSKHRLLLPGTVAAAPGKGKFTVRGLDKIKITGRHWVPFEDGAEVYRMELTPHEGSNVDVKAEVPHTIMFADPESGLTITIADLRLAVISISNAIESFAGDF
jgi:hypothetical protein